MRKTRFAVCLLAALLVLASIAAPASARKPMTDGPDLALAKMGFSDSQLSALFPEYKEHLANELGGHGRLVASTTYRVSPDKGTTDKGEVTPDGAISGSDLSLTVNVVTDTSASVTEERFYISAVWAWTKGKPALTLTDKVGIVWSGALELDQDTPRSYYYAQHSSTGETHQYVSTIPSDQDPRAGFGFEVDLLSMDAQGYMFDRHYGFIDGYIYTYNNGGTTLNTASVLASYFHQKITLTGNLSFQKGGPSISIGWATAYDRANAKGKNFYFYTK